RRRPPRAARQHEPGRAGPVPGRPGHPNAAAGTRRHHRGTGRRMSVPGPEGSLVTDHDYDYVIVGGGSAGCVLAARLSEDPGARVLLLEAGPPPDAIEIAIPAGMNRLWQGRYDGNFSTVPQERAAGRGIYWPRGRVLGGS